MAVYATNLEYLQDELRRLNLLLTDAIAQFRQHRDQTIPEEFQGFYLSDAAIDRVVAAVKSPEAAPVSELRQKAFHAYDSLQQRIIDSRQAGIKLRLPHISHLFNLSPFEQDLLLLALAPELDQRYQTLYAYLQDNVERKRPTVTLALQLFCQSLEEQIQARPAFAEASSLRINNLLQLHEDAHERPTPLLSQGLKLDARLVQFLLEDNRLDVRLTQPLPIARWVRSAVGLAALVLPKTIYVLLNNLSQQSPSQARLCLLQGPAGVGKKACAGAIAQAWGKLLLVIDLDTLLKGTQNALERLQIAWREAQLYGSVLYLDHWETVVTEENAQTFAICRWVESAISRAPSVVFLGSQCSWHPQKVAAYGVTQLEISLPDEPQRVQLWTQQIQALGYGETELDVPYLARAFRFSGGQIQRALAHGNSQAQLQQRDLQQADVLMGCRSVAQQQLIRFAQRLTPKRGWDDLVLPPHLLTQLQDFCQQLRYRTLVYGQWGFGERLSLGKGLVALFTGSSGTGKTLSAEVLATETGLDLYRIDLASVVSKYIGETEKNLSQVFQDAQTSNAILFFDEADALFGKRSDVKDAHDRYANIEVNYLLQQVEAYEGAIILASNYSKNIDDAFLRRLQFKLEFPFPNEMLRLAIWRHIFPANVPLAEDIDWGFLAKRFKLSGGNIKNVAVAAAFGAAAGDSEVGMEQIVLGVKREYQKLGKVCDKSDFGPYYGLVS